MQRFRIRGKIAFLNCNIFFKLQITFSELQTIKYIYLLKESSKSFNFLYNTPLKSPSFSNFGGVCFLTFFDLRPPSEVMTCISEKHNHRLNTFLEANFFLNERYFRRLHLEGGRGSFSFLNHEKFHNKLNKSC